MQFFRSAVIMLLKILSDLFKIVVTKGDTTLITSKYVWSCYVCHEGYCLVMLYKGEDAGNHQKDQ